MRITFVLPILCGTLAAAALIGACSKDDGGGGGPDPRCSVENVTYQGYATDETCLTMYDAEDGDAIQLGGANAPILLNPTNGEVVAVTVTSLTISWETPLDTDTTFARRAPAPRHVPLWRSILSGLDPVSTAWAHEAPVTGAIHRVRLKGVAGGDGIATWFTSLESLVLTTGGLARVTQAPTGDVSIEITSMYVNDNRILTPSDGPFRPTSDTVFTVE